MTGRNLSRLGLALACLFLGMPARAAVVDVTGTSAKLGWTAASGAVASYGVFLSKNGAAFPTTPNQVVAVPEVTITGATNDTFLVKVAAYDASGTKGPDSITSDSIHFIVAPGPPPPPPPASPALTVSTTSLNVSVVQGSNATPQSFTVRNTGGGTLAYLLAYSHDWLVLGASGGSATTETDTIPLSFATSVLTPGNYVGTITVVQTGTTTEKYITVNLTVTAAPITPPPAAIGVSSSSLAATAQKGQSPLGQNFSVRNAGGGTLLYSVAENASWLSVSPGSGTSTGENDSIALSFATTSLNTGAYTANVTVSATGLATTTIPVSLTITAPPAAIGVAPASLGASVAQGKDATATSFTVQNTGGGTLSYAVANGASWLSVSPGSGTSTGESDTVVVSFATASLASGTYTSNLTVSASGATSATIPVTLTVTTPAAAIGVSTATLSASVVKGSNASAQSFTVRNTGGGTLSYTVQDNKNWLSVSPGSGTSTGESDTITVDFDTASLATGSYTANLTTSASGATSQVVVLTLTVTDPAPALTLSTTSLTATAQKGQDATATSFTVDNTGGGTLTYAVADDVSWLSVSPASGTSTGEKDTLGVSYDTSGLAPGSYSATVTVSATGLAAQTVSVSLTVNDLAPAITLSTSSLTATVQKGSDASAASFTVRNTGGGTLGWSVSENASWLSVSPASGTATTESDSLSVSFATASLAPGNYNATLTVSGGAGVSAKSVAVSVTVDDLAPALSLSTTSLAVNVVEGSDAPATSFSVRNTGGGSLSWSAGESASWLSLAPSSGSSTGESDTVNVSFATASLAAGSHTTTIAVAGSGGAAGASVTVNVTVTEPAPAIALSTASLTASAQAGQLPAPAGFSVQNAGGGTLTYTATSSAGWLSLTPASGSSSGESDAISVVFSSAGLPAGNHAATITVAGSGAASKTIAVTLSLSAATPVLEVSTTTLDAVGAPGTNVAAQDLTVRNAGGGTLAYAITDDQAWLSLSPASGTSTGEADTLNVTFSTANLPAGTHTATLLVTAPGLPSKMVAVSVRLSAAKAVLDYDGDGRSDALFRHADSSIAGWLMDGASVRNTVTPSSAFNQLALVGVGDFDGDGKSFDFLWMNTNTGGLLVYLNDGKGGKTSASLSGVPKTWRAVGVADFDGDGKSDVLWLDPATGNVTVWLVNRFAVKRSALAGTLGAGWEVVATGDFDGDRKADVLFEQPATQERLIWFLNGVQVRETMTPMLPPSAAFTTDGAGDFNGDGRTDLVVSYGAFSMVGLMTWTGNGFAQSTLYAFVAPGAVPTATGDYDGDGRADLLWHDAATGTISIWLVDPFSFLSISAAGSMSGGWTVLGETGTQH